MGLSPDYLVPVEKAAIPKTAIGKIQRAQLRAGFEAGEFDEVETDRPRAGNSRTLPDWFFEPVWVRASAPPPGRSIAADISSSPIDSGCRRRSAER